MLGIADTIAEEYLHLVKIKDDYISAACPFHKGGEETHPSFWINRHVGNWGCFSCSMHGGNLKKLLKEMGIASRRINTQIDAAAKEAELVQSRERVRAQKKARATFQGTHSLPESLLGVYDWLPEVMIDMGFTEEILLEHDIGYDRERDRITFPIRDIFGKLIGVSGRSTIGDLPKYKVYTGKHIVDGKEVLGELGQWYPDYSSEGIRDHLWCGQFVYPELTKNPRGQLIIVEGYKAALWLKLHDWKTTVALMGSKMSRGQERLIRRMGVETFVLLDNNDPGQEGADQICQRLGVSTFPVYRCSYPRYCDENAQPDDLDEGELEEVLSTSKRVGGKPYVRVNLWRNPGSSKQVKGTTKKRWR